MIKIGKYFCTSKVGCNSASTIYQANSQTNSKQLVVKVSNETPEFENEIKLLKFCQHEGVVKFVDSFHDDSKQILVLEAGKELFQYIIDNNGFSEKEAKKLFKNIFLAVKYIHSKSIVHRDIKLENIIITEKGKLKLIDFGLASELNKCKDSKNLCGTALYLSPEVIQKKGYSEKVDIWSLGITLFGAVAGFFPFDSSDEYSYAIEALTAEPAFEDADVSESFKDLIRHMLEKNPEKRYSAEQCLCHEWFEGV
ncbi:CAMK family protein kinase [Tritrichomonas foetus]|uniref:CAMK family protein kinase n=1 Tax=Tritrichomonas foetus TaxID=1144522 RepID=A0A1J4L429_9EUKA|nr:CAMK family protein kinase [Tritrichomonas foetus]|eukprot:OHT16732.1 CAMK family protein kinase [Tritrichomonas foetus]